MSIVKKDILSHKCQERYTVLRDVVSTGVKRLGLSSPFTLGAKGFTLVELAIVLVILGTIFMSVLKVESMVKNARIRQLFNQYRELRTAILVYKDKYGYLPGDDPYAVAHVKADHAKTVAAGGGNGQISWGTGSAYGEENNYLFEHLGKAGLIKGTYSGNNSTSGNLYSDTPLLHAFSTLSSQNSILVRYDASLKSNLIQFLNLPYDVAQAFDQAFDDGVYNTGNVQSVRDYTAALTATTFYLGDPYYTTFPVGSAVSTYITFN